METGSSHNSDLAASAKAKTIQEEKFNAKRSTMLRFVDGAVGGFISGAIL